MVFKKSKKEVLASLGAREAVETLVSTGLFRGAGLILHEENYNTVYDLCEEIAHNGNVEYVILSKDAYKGIKNGLHQAIEEIRELSDDIFIVILAGEDIDKELVNFAFGKKVYNFYYSADETYDFELIIDDMLEKKMPKIAEESEALADLDKELSEKEGKIKEQESEIERLKEKVKSLEATESASPSEELLSLKSRINTLTNDINTAENEKERLKEKHEREIEAILKKTEEEIRRVKNDSEKFIEDALKKANANAKQKSSYGAVTVGIFSLSRGAGSTYTAVEIGERYASLGYKVAVVGYDGSDDLYMVSGKADYYAGSEEDKKIALTNALTSDYDFVIIDFGNCFPLLSNGMLNIATQKKADSQNELRRCQYRIGMAFTSDWHIEKFNYFLQNPLMVNNSFFVVDDIEKMYNYEINCVERDTEAIFTCLCAIQGIDNSKSKRKGLFRK